jgi:general secretion pathway protein J
MPGQTQIRAGQESASLWPAERGGAAGPATRAHPARPLRRRSDSQRGFTLLELTIALVLLALMSAVMFGSLSFAGRSWDGGEAKAAQVSEMRQTEEFLRSQISSQFPLRARKVAEFPLFFVGTADEIRYAAALPSRVAEGGLYYFRVSVIRDGERSRLVQDRVIPDPDAVGEIEFRDAERAVLAEGIGQLKLEYFGRDANAAESDAPTWRDRWDDHQRLPLLVRIDVVPEKGLPWPRLVIEPRHSPEVGCRAWDPLRLHCGGVA